MVLKVEIQDGKVSRRTAEVDEFNLLRVAVHEGTPAPIGSSSRYRYLNQLLDVTGAGTGNTNMNLSATDSGTNGACADHTGPTYTFTAVGADFTAIQSLEITDSGAAAHGILGTYVVKSVNSATSVELDRDPTDGTNETAMDWVVPTQEFRIIANADYDVRIMLIIIIVADTAVAHNAFGNISALTNGVELHIREAGVETKLLDAVKTGGQLIAQAGFAHGYGDGTTSYELSNWTGTEDAQGVVLPVGSLVPGGIRIGRGTKDHLLMRIQDDLTGLTEFTCRVLGYKHYP